MSQRTPDAASKPARAVSGGSPGKRGSARPEISAGLCVPARFSRIVQRILRLMQKASPPPLLPLLRSRLQAEVLTLVLLGPAQEWSLTGLASRTGASVSSVQREITRAEQAGVVSSRRLGNTRLVKAADSPLTVPLTELLLRSFGPRQVLSEELEGVEGIEGIYLFGSWAARYAGEVGRPPADLDVLVIGEAREWELIEYAADTITSGKKKGLIVLGHIPSEQAGMINCANWLKTFITEVPIEFIPAPEPFWSPNA